MSNGSTPGAGTPTPQARPAGRQTVLVVDDDVDACAYIERVLRNLDERVIIDRYTRPLEAIIWAAQNVADLVLVDYIMPELNGMDFVSRLRALPGYDQVPVVMVTASEDVGVRYAALDAGMTDFLTKPIDGHECVARCRNLLKMRRQQLALDGRRKLLEGLVDEATREVRERERETLYRLARAGEFRDAETGYHLVRMARYSRLLAETIGLEEEEVQAVELAAPLHDIGKIGIPDYILLKAGALDVNEWVTMRTHPAIGYEILKDSSSKYVRMGALIALGHHERFDGSGYPKGVGGEKIPLSARIVAVADVYDALTSVRPYKGAWPSAKAFEYLTSAAGKHLDPELVGAFVRMRPEVERIQSEFVDRPDRGPAGEARRRIEADQRARDVPSGPADT